MRIATTLLCAVAVTGQPGGPQMPPCLAQGVKPFMQCAQQNNVDLASLQPHGPPPSSPADKADMICGAYNTIKPCWGVVTTVADNCVTMAESKPQVAAMIGPNLLKGITDATMKCLPQLCEAGAAETTMRKAHMVLRQLFRPTKGKKRQEMEFGGGGMQQEEEDAEMGAEKCLQGEKPAIMQCAKQNNIGPQTFGRRPPQPPITGAIFCGLFSKIAPCLPAIQTALDHCSHAIEQKAGVPGNIHPVAALNCFLNNANDACAGAARGESRSAVAAVPKMVRMLAAEQQKDYTPAVAVLVLGLAIVGAMFYYNTKPQQKPEDPTYGAL